MHARWILIAACLIMPILNSACSTKPSPDGGLKPRTAEAPVKSSLEISYVLGHDLRRLLLEERSGIVTAREFHDRTLLKEATLSGDGYAKLLEKVREFVDRQERAPASDARCRNPFAVTVKSPAQVKTRNGCRAGDDGALLAQLAREAQFLMYSKK